MRAKTNQEGKKFVVHVTKLPAAGHCGGSVYQIDVAVDVENGKAVGQEQEVTGGAGA